MPVTAIHVQNKDVLPDFRQQKATITIGFSNYGRGFFCPLDRRSNELFLNLIGGKHRATKVRHPHFKGFCCAAEPGLAE